MMFFFEQYSANSANIIYVPCGFVAHVRYSKKSNLHNASTLSKCLTIIFPQIYIVHIVIAHNETSTLLMYFREKLYFHN